MTRTIHGPSQLYCGGMGRHEPQLSLHFAVYVDLAELHPPFCWTRPLSSPFSCNVFTYLGLKTWTFEEGKKRGGLRSVGRGLVVGKRKRKEVGAAVGSSGGGTSRSSCGVGVIVRPLAFHMRCHMLEIRSHVT